MKETHPGRIGVGCHTSNKADVLKSLEVSLGSCHRFQWNDNDKEHGSLNAFYSPYNSEDHYFKVHLHNGWPGKNNGEC